LAGFYQESGVASTKIAVVSRENFVVVHFVNVRDVEFELNFFILLSFVAPKESKQRKGA
jgi:hypothetical protein